jgi:hypothetical protein
MVGKEMKGAMAGRPDEREKLPDVARRSSQRGESLVKPLGEFLSKNRPTFGKKRQRGLVRRGRERLAEEIWVWTGPTWLGRNDGRGNSSAAGAIAALTKTLEAEA